MNAAPSSTLGATSPSASQAPRPPVGVFPTPPRGTTWQSIPSSAIPAGIRIPQPLYVTKDNTFIYARGVLTMPDGRAWMVLRIYPRVGGLRQRVDHYYQAMPTSDWIARRGSLGAPSGAVGWNAWTGDLPAPVAAAFQNGRKAGTEFRATIGSRAWIVRPDARGRATYTLGAPPFVRRVSVSAWRWDGPLPESRARAVPRRALVPVAFVGEPANPWPPMGDGWAETAPDESQRDLVAGLLGELPMSHYVDAMSPTGLYRFFAYETGAGQKAIGSLRYWGATLGAPSTLGDVATDKAGFDNSVTIGDTAIAAGNWGGAVMAYQSAGNLGATTLGPEIDAQTGGASQPITQQAWGINTTLATLPSDATATQQDAQAAQGLAQQMKALYEQAIALPSGGGPATPPSSSTLTQAAIAMNNALLAHGYKQRDQPLYRTFQAAAGLGVDGFPGTATMNALFNALAGAGELPAPVKIYPWLRTGAFDGVNAPTLAEWTGAAPGTLPGGGGGPPVTPPGGGGVTPPGKPTVAQAGMSTGGTVAAVLGTVLVIGGVAWAAATGHLPHWALPK